MYKYTRKEITKWIKDKITLAGDIDDEYDEKDISKMLLAKESKEEYSQKIMMEQVDKDDDRVKRIKYLGEKGKLFKVSVEQDKPVCEHCKFVPNGIIKIDDDGKCIYCDKQIGLTKKQMKNISPPIEDTNKTSLEHKIEHCVECGGIGYDFHLFTCSKFKQELEVPEKLLKVGGNDYQCGGYTIENVGNKINEIIDYLTLISLDKK